MKQIKYFIFIMLLFFQFSHAEDPTPPAVASPTTPAKSKKYVEIEWEAVPGAVRYELEILSLKTKKLLKTFHSRTNIFKLNVKFGKYLVRSRIFDNAETASPWSETSEILIAPPPLLILNHSNPEVPIQVSKKTALAEIKIDWEAQEGVAGYKLLIETSDGKLVRDVKTNTNWARVMLPVGNYKFRAQALLPDESETEPGPYSDEFTFIGAEIDPPKISIIKKKGGMYLAQVEVSPSTALLWGQLEYLPLEGETWTTVQEFKGVPLPVIDLKKLTPGNYKITLFVKAEKYTDSKKTVLDFLVKPIRPDLEIISVEIAKAVSDKSSSASKSK
jgi:hypothetical protein